MAEKVEGKKDEVNGVEDDFRALFEKSIRSVKPGEVVTGKVVDNTPTHVVVDVGYKTEGQIQIREFSDQKGNVLVKVGDDVEVFFDSSGEENGDIVLSREKAEEIKVWGKIEESYEKGTPVDGTIESLIKGGFKVNVGVPGFLPASHVDIRPTRNLDKFVGSKDRFIILKYDRLRENVVVSRKVLIEKERELLKSDTLKILEEGIILEGLVKNITSYGAFVDIGGIDGILHITDMSWGRINHPSDLVNVGDSIKVVVIKFDTERERLSLGMKQITPDPWNVVEEKFIVGTRVLGKVISITDYGAFVELEKGVEGLIHITEMSWSRKIAHPSRLVKLYENVETEVLKVDRNRRRISLGLKQVMTNPWVLAKEKYPVGSVVNGSIRSITDFGIFVSVEEGIDGLVHVSDLHWTKKIKHPSELYKKGDNVEAKVLAIDVENERFSLGVKHLTKDPWDQLSERYPVGSKIEGEVTRVPDFGVFVRIEDGVEGLIHVSQLSTERVDKPSSLFKAGDRIEAEILNIDANEKKVALSIRALRTSEERKELESYLKKEKDASKFSFETILNEELSLDKEEDKDSEKENN